MFKQKPFLASIVVGIVLIILHLVASSLSWYWKYPRFDVIIHIVSGLWVALVILWLVTCLGQINTLKEYKIKSFLIAFLAAVLAGVMWEIFENLGQVTYTNLNGYYVDTAGDIINTAIGGILAYLYFIKRRHCADKSCEVLHPFHDNIGLINN